MRGAAERLIGVEERGGALAKLAAMEAEDAVGASVFFAELAIEFLCLLAYLERASEFVPSFYSVV